MNLQPDVLDLETLLANFLAFLPGLVVSLVVFVLTLYLAGVVGRAARKGALVRKFDQETAMLLAQVTRWTVLVLGTIFALDQVGFNVAAFLAGLGIVGFTVGFALQDVSKNFVAGLLLLLQQPFQIGDAIEVKGYSGQVLAVSLRATEIRAFDGKIVLIPNADVFTNALVNYSRATRRRIEISHSVPYGTDLAQVRAVALEAVRALPGILAEPAPSLAFTAFGPTAIQLTLYYWCDTALTDLTSAQDAGIVALEQAYTRAGIEPSIPPQRLVLEQLSPRQS